MAPTPVDDNLLTNPTFTAKPEEGYWTKSNIAVTIVFAVLALAVALLLLAFGVRKRSEKKKKNAHRKSDKVGLLENEDKASMFSKERHSSVTLYVDSDSESKSNNVSQESMPLVPLQITPLEEVHDPLNRPDYTTPSYGSGVSAMSRLSNNTASTMMLSPVSLSGDDGDLSTRPSGRPRSASTTSQKARYYESTPLNAQMPPIPRIIRTPSD